MHVLRTRMKFPVLGNDVPSLVERNSHSRGTGFPQLGNSFPSLWEKLGILTRCKSIKYINDKNYTL